LLTALQKKLVIASLVLILAMEVLMEHLFIQDLNLLFYGSKELTHLKIGLTMTVKD